MCFCNDITKKRNNENLIMKKGNAFIYIDISKGDPQRMCLFIKKEMLLFIILVKVTLKAFAHV